MTYFAVEYVYDPAATETMDRIRPEHRAYLGSLVDRGVNIASGPWVGAGAGALLLFDCESKEEVRKLLDRDPFWEAGVITERTIRQWNPVLGRL